jgi:hypothetical protein
MNWLMHHATKTYTEIEVQRHALLISALHRGVRLASRSVPFTPEEKVPGTHWRGSQVDPRAGLETAEKSRVYFAQTRSRMPKIRSPSTIRTDRSLPATGHNCTAWITAEGSARSLETETGWQHIIVAGNSLWRDTVCAVYDTTCELAQGASHI